MTEALGRLNAATTREAYEMLLRCCASTRWARRVVEARPYGGGEALLETAGRIWWDLSRDDWREALAGHPRIGEAASDLARREQSQVTAASTAVRVRLADMNRRYEERFGHIFLIRADGRSAAEMLQALESRMENDPRRELEIAAQEEAAIMRLRLRRWLDQGEP